LEKAEAQDGVVDALLFTQFCDKKSILSKSRNLKTSKRKFDDELGRIQSLRDHLAHERLRRLARGGQQDVRNGSAARQVARGIFAMALRRAINQYEVSKADQSRRGSQTGGQAGSSRTR
jgi:hypothetical protein